MEIVVSTHHLGLGGSESYLLTVSEQLQRLGHGVTIFARELGAGVETAHGRGLEIVDREERLPDRCDVVFAQESVTAYQLADRYPSTPQVYAVHADEYDLSVPPQIPGLVQAAVVLNDRVERRVRALAVVPEVIRLRQPVDTQRFSPRSPLHEPPRRALLLGNYVTDDRYELVAEACAAVGLECAQVGYTRRNWTPRPDLELCEADIVIGKARVIVEAMACGRAAYVYDHNGGDGWVTPERYATLEADNFGGQAEPTATDVDRLRRDLAAYSRHMGPANRDLAVANHSANRHAQELVALFQRLAPSELPAEAPLRELARLARVQWAGEGERIALASETHRLRSQLDALRAEHEQRARSRPARLARAGARRLGARRVRAAWRAITRSSTAAQNHAHGL